MDAQGFDAFTRQLTSGLPRRKAITFLAAAGLFIFPGRAPSAEAGCKKVGKKCEKNKDCCDKSTCKGKKCKCKSGLEECGGKCKNLENDGSHCGACNNVCPAIAELCVAGGCASCPAGADHCVSATASCQNDSGCYCLKRLEDGAAICTALPRCDQPCDDETGCPGGPSICVSAGDVCCPGSAGQGRCADLCGA